MLQNASVVSLMSVLKCFNAIVLLPAIKRVVFVSLDFFFLPTFNQAVGHQPPIEGSMHALERNNLADSFVPNPRTGENDRPRVPDADPNGVSPGGDGVFDPVFALNFFHDVSVSH